MEGTEHEKTFFYRHKIIVMNLLVMMVIIGVDPELLLLLPQSTAADYYSGVFILFTLFLEVVSVWYTSRMLFSFPNSLFQKVPARISASFLPRVLVSGAIATLAIDVMKGFHLSEFFLIPIVLYAVSKEFWVRSVLLFTEREKTVRPNGFQVFMGDFSLFIFMITAYFAIWKVYLLESPRLMFMVMSPINWGFASLAMLGMLYSMQMPLFWEDHIKPKSDAQKRLAYLSLLLPVVALIGRFFLQSYLRE